MSTKLPLITTADPLLAASKDLDPCELVRGKLIIMAPAGEEHSRIEGNLFLALGTFVRTHKLGRGYTGDAGLLLEQDPDTVRAPDVAFVGASRISAVPHRGYFPGPPDLAVEIRSRDDRPNDIATKIQDYLRLGVQVVWDVDPMKRTVTAHCVDSEPQDYAENDTISEPEMLPGFQMPIADAFRW